jgi:hypothetical protein
MMITETITKKILETIVHETFSSFGVLTSSSLLDSLKFLGFYYATNAGISINIEDLKTPNTKKEFLDITNQEILDVSQRWQYGKISDTERFQSIIDSWNVVTESLKHRIVDYYQDFDPANNLYIMAFSGARGNMSQVRQLVGLRGLMSDQEGKIIDLPIQRNFREGLSSIDYVISSYGARKGIVDTALKTADSGYLTRRLIYLSQDLVIREIDCKSRQGVTILLNKSTTIQNVLGRYILSVKPLTYPFSEQHDTAFLKGKIFTLTEWNNLKKKLPVQLEIRSVLTCQSINSLCQKCYGWDLAQKKLISLGEAVGIIASQSIGEPGTQLTMRTFHTGGIFTGETLKQIVSPFSGKLILPDSLNITLFRTNHGVLVFKLQQEVTLYLLDWKGKKENIFLSIGSYLYHKESSFIKKGEKIAEYATQSLLLGMPRLKPLYSPLSGELLKFENLHIRKQKIEENRTLRVNIQEGAIWVGLGKIFVLPKETRINFSRTLDNLLPLGKIKIISPFSGYIELVQNGIILWNKEKKIYLEFSNLISPIKNCTIKILPTIQSYQYIDAYTTIAHAFIFQSEISLIYSIRKKESKYTNTFFFITESDIWKTNSDQVNSYKFFQEKRQEVLPLLAKTKESTRMMLNSTSTFNHSGFFLKKNGFQMIFQTAVPIYLNSQTILNYRLGDFILEKQVLGTLLKYNQQTEDIVQGLPKIEELIEARKPKNPCLLAYRPGIFLISLSKKHIIKHDKNDIIRCILGPTKKVLLNDISKKSYFAHSFFQKKELIHFQGEYFKSWKLPPIFVPYRNLTRKPPLFKKPLMVWSFMRKPDFFKVDPNINILYSRFPIQIQEKKELFLRNYIKKWKNIPISSSVYAKKEKENYILQFRKNEPFYLFKKIRSILAYRIPENVKFLPRKGSFIDLGEPITEGIIDIHELLTILFEYHSTLDGLQKGTKRCLTKFQLLLVHSIQSIYQSQGVTISTKHIEIIVLQMTSKVMIRYGGDTPLLTGEYIAFCYIQEICEALKADNSIVELPTYEPKLLSATYSSINKDSFLSSAGFQETRRVLAKAAIEGKCDWLRGLKECIMNGRLVPAGTSFLNYKNYLDKIYYFQQSL